MRFMLPPLMNVKSISHQGLKSLATDGDPSGVAKCGPVRDYRG
jgi:hypothetical protein